jgi:hypothetical protein
MKLKNTPSTDYAFGYKEKPQSGNEINGLGETKKVRARHVFHNATGEPLPWDALDTFFSYINLWGVVRHMLGNVWQLRRQDGPVSKKRVPVDDPARMAGQIKAEAKRRGAGIVGVTEISEDMLYEGHEVPYKYAIAIGLPMRRRLPFSSPPLASISPKER